MKVSLKWLNEYVDIKDIKIEELAQKITIAGVEIEAIEYLSRGNNLVIGKVLECDNHPQSDHLHVCKVDIKEQISQIVCGAPNVAKGQKVIVALPGAILPAKGITIQKSVIRGVESNGMICSLLELGVDEKYLSKESIEGIEVLSEDAPIGHKDPLNYLGYDDVSFELKLTPDRGDCLSLYSFAKEVGAIFNRKVKPLEVKTYQESSSTLKCSSETPLCNIINIKAVKGIKVKPAPDFMQKYLIACGIRSINNVVDIGNYVMLLTGQPLHMYDINKLKSDKFIVKDNVNNTFKALDENDYQVLEQDIVISNGDEIACLGGVMGSYSTMIDDNTQNVAIEAANFNGVNVRKTSRRLQLFSDSATRFVRGIDLNRCQLALNLAVDLLVKYADAQIIENTVTFDKVDHSLRNISLTLNKVNSSLGTSFTLDDVKGVFTALDFPYQISGDKLIITVPSYRNDISIDSDLIEEIIRIKGFEHLPLTVPLSATMGQLNEVQHKRKLIRQHLVANGINETMTYTLDEPKYDGDFNIFNKNETITLLHPMSEERSFLRKSIVPTLLHCINYNASRNITDINLFEISNVYTKNGQHARLALALQGSINNVRLYKTREADFYTIKGLVESILTLLGIEQTRYQYLRVEKENQFYHSGRSVYLISGKTVVGVIGQIHPKMEVKYDVKATYVAELDLDEIFKMKSSHVKFAPIWQYPPISRDIAVVLSKEVEVSNIIKTIKKVSKGLITNIEVFDVYMGEHIEIGKKSVAISLTYQDKNKTLTDKDVNEVHQKVIETIENDLNAKLRV